MAAEQAALRRVATLVARGAAPEEVFTAVTEEVARLLVAELTIMCRYEPDGRAFTIVGSVGSLGKHWPRWQPLGPWGQKRHHARVRDRPASPH
ncbi:MAG: hypothetical protein QOF83_637 [Solirubrobacteraceae bacterium]|nr:hypothetical protein [Solirubrobacteraceae bacterium]